MDRIGIVEMANMEPATQSKQEIVQMLATNNFQMIQEGFTGIYLMYDEFQIVPNELLPRIKELSSGFSHYPEDHEMMLFSEWKSNEGQMLRIAISAMVTAWLDKLML